MKLPKTVATGRFSFFSIIFPNCAYAKNDVWSVTRFVKCG